MSDGHDDIEARFAALELMVAFLFASQHLQTADPAAALNRLKTLLEQLKDGHVAPADSPSALGDVADRFIERVAELQEILPKRLVD